jgi:hypothetical protein
LSLQLPGSESPTPLAATDESGETSVDMVEVMAGALAAGVPKFVDILRNDQVDEVTLGESVVAHQRGVFGRFSAELSPKAKKRLDLTVGGSKHPLVARLTLSCKAHLRVRVALQKKQAKKRKANGGKNARPPSEAGETDVAGLARETIDAIYASGGRVESGTPQGLIRGKELVAFCRSGRKLTLQLQAGRASAASFLVEAAAEAHRPRGKVLRAREGLFVLDKGREDFVFPGRTGTLYGRRGKKAPFEVVKATAERAVARRVDSSEPGRRGRRRRSRSGSFRAYELDP